MRHSISISGRGGLWRREEFFYSSSPQSLMHNCPASAVQGEDPPYQLRRSTFLVLTSNAPQKPEGGCNITAFPGLSVFGASLSQVTSTVQEGTSACEAAAGLAHNYLVQERCKEEQGLYYSHLYACPCTQ